MTWARTSRHARGYGSEWDRIRKLILERDEYLCQCRHCKTEGRTTLATEVDHVVPKAQARRMGWSTQQIDHPSNLASINEDCHKRKTQEDNGATWQPKRTIGVDGWPINSRTRGGGE